MLFGKEFYTIGLGKSLLKYYSSKDIYFAEDKSTAVLLEYGYDEMELYRAYFDISINSQVQGIGAMIEWAPRFSVIPQSLKMIIGIPSIYLGFGIGYNHLNIEGHNMLSP